MSQDLKLQPILRRGGLKNWAVFLFLRFRDQPLTPSRHDDASPAPNAIYTDASAAVEAMRRQALINRRAAFLKLYDGLEGITAKTFDRASPTAQKPATKALLDNATLAFTYTGLKDLGVHPDTVESFPDAFKEGMAARAELIGDVGPNGPEHWHGRLGSRDIHAVLIVSGHHLSKTMPAVQTEAFRKQMRALAANHQAWQSAQLFAHFKALFETAESHQDSELLEDVLAAFADVDILDFEFGEDPYRRATGKHAEEDVIELVKPRVEHFGFRDGLSQPFYLTDGKPVAPKKGGGRPYADGSWAPVATGELLLGYDDEDGKKINTPVNPDLRQGGTYLVLRKLEQDVHGFQEYLDAQAGPDGDSERLAAQMMGRWRNGAPIVEYPETPHGYKGTDWSSLNDFDYSADPHGLICPIGAHVRRLNPRDFNAGEAARRHRMLRRSIAYGGGLLAKGGVKDSTPRGMFFMALVSRIDLQFELVQRDWLNGGELFGQVGAGKCPVSGNNDGQYKDSFSPGKSPAKHTHIPQFVTLRGGDYFFVPSQSAMATLLQKLSEPTAGPLFPPHMAQSKATVSAMDTPSLLAKERIDAYGRAILDAPAPTKPPSPFAPSAKRVRIQDGTDPETKAPKHMVFLGRYQDVVHVQNNSAVFTERHYNQIGLDLGGDRVIIGEPADSPIRSERLKLLHSAYYTLGRKYLRQPTDPAIFKAIRSKDLADLTAEERQALMDSVGAVTGAMRKVIKTALAGILARVGPAGKMDLLQDMGFAVPYAIAAHLFGIPGPSYLTPIAVSTAFSKSEITEVPASWLREAKSIPPAAIPYISLQTWTRFAFAEVFTNILRASELTRISRKAYDEFARHIENLITDLQRAPPQTPTLLSELVENSAWTVSRRRAVKTTDPDIIRENLKQSRLALTDIMGALMVNIGPPFGKMMDLILRQPISVRAFIDHHCGSNPGQPPHDNGKLNAFIDESLRFEPAASIQFRTVKLDKETVASGYPLPSGALVHDGDLIAMIIKSANMDEEFDPNQDMPVYTFSTERDPNVYIGFGGQAGRDGGPSPALHFCWGEQIGRLCLREMLVTCWGLGDLRRAVGPQGEMQNLLLLPYSLQVRFNPIG